jgi:hypothetical protein
VARDKNVGQSSLLLFFGNPPLRRSHLRHCFLSGCLPEIVGGVDKLFNRGDEREWTLFIAHHRLPSRLPSRLTSRLMNSSAAAIPKKGR